MKNVVFGWILLLIQGLHRSIWNTKQKHVQHIELTDIIDHKQYESNVPHDVCLDEMVEEDA